MAEIGRARDDGLGGSVRKASGDPKAIMDDLRKTLAEYKSAY